MNREQPTRRHVERVIQDEIGRLLAQRTPSGAPVARGDALEELGLSSLDVVQLAVSLAVRLGVDPFQRASITDLRTIGDLCEAYERALAGDGRRRPDGPPWHRVEAAVRRTRSRESP